MPDGAGPQPPRPVGLLWAYVGVSGAGIGALVLAASLASSLQDSLLAVSWIVAATAATVTGFAVVHRSTNPFLRKAWIAWSAACAVWAIGALVRLVAEVTGWENLAAAADVAWWMFPVLAGASILEDAPRGSLSFGLFLLDALPLVLLVTLLSRLAAAQPLEEERIHELMLLGYPLLYLLLALVGLQMLALERNRLRSPNVWGFAVSQPLLAVAALTWPATVVAGSVVPSFIGGILWSVGFLASAVAAVVRAREPDSSPTLLPLDDSGFRALPPAIGTVGLLAVAAIGPESGATMPFVLALTGVACFTARAFVIQRENRRAHANLQMSEEQHRTLIDNIPGAVYRCAFDRIWTIDFMSEEIETITGFPAESFKDNREHSFATIEHPEDAETLNEVIRRDVAAGRPYAHEYRIVRADGEIRWVLDKGQAAYGNAGEVLWIDGVLLDVTDRKHTEERFERQTELLWMLQRVAVAANEARDVDEALQVCLDEVCSFTGWDLGHVLFRAEDRDELVSTGLWHVGDEDGTARFRADSERRVFASGVGLPGRVLATGRAHWVEDVTRDVGYVRAETVRDLSIHAAIAFPVLVGPDVVAVLEFYGPESTPRDDGLLRVLANVGTVLGRVVERTRAEQALAAQNEQLLQLDALKDEFVSLVSHELRTPLTSIRGYLELVLEDEESALTAEHRQFLAVVQRNSERLLRLVGDLLFVAQVDAGRLVIEPEDLDLATVAAESVQAAEPFAAGKGVELVLEADPSPLAGDPARLTQLVDNLVSNAVKFTPQGGRVTVRVGPSAGAATVEVADTGMGIPADEQHKLFQRFFRSTNARRAAVPGTGLGLVVVRAIADAHGGTVSLESEEGAGTTFRVELPSETLQLPAVEESEDRPMKEVA